jgi:hypothetical protein
MWDCLWVLWLIYDWRSDVVVVDLLQEIVVRSGRNISRAEQLM